MPIIPPLRKMTPHRQSDRAFGLTFAAVFAVITAVGSFVFDARLFWAAWTSAGFLLLALVLPSVLLPLNRLWGVLGARIARAFNFVLLALFFYLFVLPLGLIIRLTSRDAMHRDPDPETKTYWTPVTRHTDESTLHDMF